MGPARQGCRAQSRASLQGLGLKPALAELGQTGVAMWGLWGLQRVHVGTGHSQQGWMGKVLLGRDWPIGEGQIPPLPLVLPPWGRGLAPGGAGEGAWGLPDPPLSVLCPSHLSSLPTVPNRTQNCTGGSLPPPKIGHLNSKLFLNEIAKKEKQLRKLLEGG